MRKTFRRASRILKGSEFKIVYRKGRRVSSKHLRMLVLGGGEARLGLTIGRRVGNAVERNRLKRVIRETFRLKREVLKPGDYVVEAREGAGSLTNEKLREGLEDLLRKI